MSDHQTQIFVAAVLYSMEGKWRDRFQEILWSMRGISIHKAWFVLKEEKLLDRFAHNFYFDPLYDRSNLSEIVADLSGLASLVRLDGTDFHYHLDMVSSNTIQELMRRHDISELVVKTAAARLCQVLEEQEKAIHPPVL